MRWELTFGKSKSSLGYHWQLHEQGAESAFDADKLPDPLIGFDWVKDAYRWLSKRRSVEHRADMSGASLKVERIQTSEIESYCRIEGITDERQVGDLMYFIDRMDDEFLDLVPKGRKRAPGTPQQ